MDFTLTTYAWGLASSVVTEIFKFVPFLNKNNLTRSVTAIIVVAVAAWIQSGSLWSWDVIIPTLGFAFLNYKMVVQPLAKVTNIATQ